MHALVLICGCLLAAALSVQGALDPALRGAPRLARQSYGDEDEESGIKDTKIQYDEYTTAPPFPEREDSVAGQEENVLTEQTVTVQSENELTLHPAENVTKNGTVSHVSVSVGSTYPSFVVPYPPTPVSGLHTVPLIPNYYYYYYLPTHSVVKQASYYPSYQILNPFTFPYKPAGTPQESKTETVSGSKTEVNAQKEATKILNAYPSYPSYPYPSYQILNPFTFSYKPAVTSQESKTETVSGSKTEVNAQKEENKVDYVHPYDKTLMYLNNNVVETQAGSTGSKQSNGNQIIFGKPLYQYSSTVYSPPSYQVPSAAAKRVTYNPTYYVPGQSGYSYDIHQYGNY